MKSFTREQLIRDAIARRTFFSATPSPTTAPEISSAAAPTSTSKRTRFDLMHYRGLLRIARKDNGVRVYALPLSEPVDFTPAERAQRLLRLEIFLRK